MAKPRDWSKAPKRDYIPPPEPRVPVARFGHDPIPRRYKPPVLTTPHLEVVGGKIVYVEP